MAAEGLLIADTPEPGRGTRYRLAPEAAAVLMEMERDEAVVGALAPRQELLLVKRPKSTQRERLQQVLAARWVGEAVSWAARVDGGWLLAFEDLYQLERLEIELNRIGIASRAHSVGDVMTGRDLGKRAAWVLEDVESGAGS